MDINLINNMLLQGHTVKEVRQELGISEKKFQKQIKELGYKFDQKKKAYVKALEPHTEILDVEPIKDTVATTNYTTNYTTLQNNQIKTFDILFVYFKIKFIVNKIFCLLFMVNNFICLLFY